MTYAPTHRTELLDANMRKCVPEPKPVRVATEPGRGFDEAEYTRQMLALVGTKGHRSKMPRSWDFPAHSSGREPDELTKAMIAVLADWITPSEIAVRVSDILGDDVTVQRVNSRLHKSKALDVEFKQKTKRIRAWKLKVAK